MHKMMLYDMLLIKNRADFISKGGFFDNEKFDARRTKKTLEKKLIF